VFSENNIIKSFLEKFKEAGEINKELIKKLKTTFADKIDRALETMERGIIQYTFTPSKRILWTAIGDEREHILYPGLYCDCLDFYKNVVINKKNSICKHLLAQILSLGLKNFKKITLNDEEFIEIYKNNKLKI